MDIPVVFAASYESLIRALRGHLNADVYAQYRALGVDLERPLSAAYPLETWVKSLELACELLAPGQPREQQSHVVGTRVVLSFAETTVGKATFALLRIMGPRRGLERMRRNLRMSNNYSETTLKELPDGGVELWCSQVTFPHYYRGVFEAGLISLGAKNVVVKVLSHDAKGAAFEIRYG